MAKGRARQRRHHSTLGNWLAERRLALGVNVKAMAAKTRLSKETIAAYEGSYVHSYKPHKRIVKAICDGYQVAREELLQQIERNQEICPN